MDEYDNEMGWDITTFTSTDGMLQRSGCMEVGDITTFFGKHIRNGRDYNFFSEHRKGAFAAALDALPPHA